MNGKFLVRVLTYNDKSQSSWSAGRRMTSLAGGCHVFSVIPHGCTGVPHVTVPHVVIVVPHVVIVVPHVFTVVASVPSVESVELHCSVRDLDFGLRRVQMLSSL